MSADSDARRGKIEQNELMPKGEALGDQTNWEADKSGKGASRRIDVAKNREAEKEASVKDGVRD